TQLGIVIEDGVRYDNGTPVLNLNDHAEYPWLRTSTPAGGQYAITLPDGSKVWLNAASTLNFPQSFSPSERLVQLEGEAYFEIAHRPNQPFIVESNGQRIQVLGTHFNVKAYS